MEAANRTVLFAIVDLQKKIAMVERECERANHEDALSALLLLDQLVSDLANLVLSYRRMSSSTEFRLTCPR